MAPDFETDPKLTEAGKRWLRREQWELDNPEEHKRQLERMEEIHDEYNLYGGPDYL